MRIIKKVEQQIWGTITAAANETYTKQYVATWQQISKPVLAPSFDLEGSGISAFSESKMANGY